MQNKADKVDIDELTGQLFEKMEDFDHDFLMCDGLSQNAALIREIAGACEKTSIFTSAHEKFERFRIEFEGDYAPEDRLKAAWLHLLQNLAGTNNSILMKGAIRLNMPLVSLYLPPEPQIIDAAKS